MIHFVYDQRYDFSSYNKSKRQIEGTFQKYFKKRFEAYLELDIKISLLPHSYFKDKQICASVNVMENNVKFDFDILNDYFCQLAKQHNKNLIMPHMRKTHNFIFNSLHHEIQHIINHVDYKEIFNYINNMSSPRYVKAAISGLLDEYVASYSAQKQVYFPSGMLDGGLAYICSRKDQMLISKITEKLDFYLELYPVLSYAIAEAVVLTETNGFDMFNKVFEDENIAYFREIFMNIKILLEDFQPAEYVLFSKDCEVEVIKLLNLLAIDLEFLKKVDDVAT